MKIVKGILGIIIFIIGIIMCVFAWLYCDNQTMIIELACFYVSLFISIMIMAIGIACFLYRKVE